MANPNLVNVTSIYANSINGALDTTLTTDLLTCAADKVIKVNTIIIANIDGTNAATVTMGVIKSGGSVVHFAKTISVPADATLVLLIRIQASTWKKEIFQKGAQEQTQI